MPSTPIGQVIEAFINTDGHQYRQYITIELSQEGKRLMNQPHLKMLFEFHPEKTYTTEALRESVKEIVGTPVFLETDESGNKTVKVANSKLH